MEIEPKFYTVRGQARVSAHRDAETILVSSLVVLLDALLFVFARRTHNALYLSRVAHLEWVSNYSFLGPRGVCVLQYWFVSRDRAPLDSCI